MPSNVDQYGVQTTVQGFNLFVSQLGAAANAAQQLGSKIVNTTNQVNRLGNIQSGGGLAALPSVANTATSALSGLGNVLGKILTIAGGIITAGVFRNIAAELGNIVGAAFEAAASFQTLQIRLEGLRARQLRAADSTLSVADSMEIASGQAAQYLNWVKNLALQTPFGTQDIAQLFTLAQAYNFTADEAAALTQAIVDFASGMGLTGQEMTRIIENFGQMRAAGKVTGTELRDLARGAFVPVNDIIRKMAENLGIAAEDFAQFREDVASGKVPVDEFFKAFNQLAETDFSGAAERMSRTWEGVTERVRDFIQTVIGVEVLGPILQRFTNVAASALDVLTSPEVRAAGTQIGLALAQSFDQIWASLTQRLIPALQMLASALGLNIPNFQTIIGWIAAFTTVMSGSIDAIANFVNTVGVNFATSIAAFADQAWGWGQNIVAQLAQGIVEGGGTLLTQAMQWIGQLLANWLQPGSPPKVAQDILKWGAGTFEEYLKGFGKADFAILDDLQSPLKSALDILTQTGDLSKDAAANLFGDISENIAKAIAEFNATGQINTDVFAGLNSSAGAFGDELQTLLEDELAYQQAVEAVAAAQEALNAAQDAQKTAQGQVKSLTQEYNALLRAGADESVLQAKLAEINAAEQARNLATEQAKAAQDALDTSKEALGPLQDQLEAQKALIAQLLELARIQAGAIETPAPGETGGGGGGGGTGGGGGFEFPPLPDTGTIDDFFAELQQKFADGLADLAEKMINFVQGIIAWWNAMWQGLLAAITSSELFQVWANVWNQAWLLVQNIWGLIGQFVAGGINTLIALWGEHVPKISYLWGKAWDLLVKIVTDTFIFVGEEIGKRLEEINGFFEDNKETFAQIIDDFWYLVYVWADFWLTQTEIFVSQRLTALGTLWELAKANILPKVSSLWASISQTIGTLMQSIVNLVAGQLAILRDWWDEHGRSVQIVVSTLMGFLGNLFDGGLLLIGGIISAALNYMQGYWDTFSTAISGIVEMLTDDIQGIWEAALDLVGAAFDTFAALFTGDWEGFWNGIKDWFVSFWELVGELFTGALEAIIAIIALWVANVLSIFTGLWNALVGNSIIPDMLADIQNAFETFLTAIATWIDTNFIQPVEEAWQTFLDTLNTAVTNLETAMTTAFTTLFNNVKTAIQDVWDDIKTAFDTFLENKLLQAIFDFFNDFYNAGKSVIMKFIDGITAMGGALYTALKNLILTQINAALAALGLPTLGGNEDTSQVGGTDDQNDLRAGGYLQAQMQAQAARALAPSQSRMTAAPVYNSYSVVFNTTINDGMDAAEYEALIHRTVDRMLP